jgi:hypothetical protein
MLRASAKSKGADPPNFNIRGGVGVGVILYRSPVPALQAGTGWLWLDSWLKTAGWVVLHGQGFHEGPYPLQVMVFSEH